MTMTDRTIFEAVIFDFGGVFTTSPVSNFSKFERENGLPEKFIGSVIKENHHTNAWAQYERAEIDLKAFDGLFAAESKTAGFEISGRTLVGLLKLEFHEVMIDALARVKAAGFKTGCITNNLPEIDSGDMVVAGADKLESLNDIFKNFDHVIESSKVGIRKPEPRIYEMMCEALGVAPSSCIFLDDLGINLKPARAMGMMTIKVPLDDVRPAIQELETILPL